MDPECRKITREMVPAVRAYLADVMSKRYGYKQQDIARRLGIAQVAVSKYMNMRYSGQVARLKEEVARHAEDTHFVETVLKSKSADEVNERIERFCEESIAL